MKSIRPNPRNHADEGDERIRTAEQAPSADSAYGIHEKRGQYVWNAPTAEWLRGPGESLFAAVFEDGYHTVWYSKRELAVAAAERRQARGGAR